MTPTAMKQRIAEASPRRNGRLSAVFYLLTIVAGIVVFLEGGRQDLVLDVIAIAFYVVVTVFFYVLTRGA